MRVEIKKIEGFGVFTVDDDLNVYVNDVKRAKAKYVTHQPKQNNDVLFLEDSHIKNENGIVNGIIIYNAEKVEELIQKKKLKDEAEKAAKIAADTEKAMAANIETFFYEMGCDTSDTIQFFYDYDDSICYEARAARDRKDEKLLKAISKIPAEKLKEIEALGSVTTLEAGLFSYGGFRTSDKKIINALIAEAEKIIAKEDEAKKVKADEKAAKEKAAFEKAKATGQPQPLSMYTVDCDESVEDCSWDNIITYAMPDGTTQTRRVHTY